jgi:nitrate reductase gamma subunit
MVVTGLAPAGVLFGFGVLLIATGLFYGLLIPVQPMKAVLRDSLRSGAIAGAGSVLGVARLYLGYSRSFCPTLLMRSPIVGVVRPVSAHVSL